MNAPQDERDPELDRLIEGHLDGMLDEDDEHRLGRLVAESAGVAERLARAILVHDRLIDLFIRLVHQNAGTLSRSKRAAHFAMLTDDEVVDLERIVAAEESLLP